MMFFNWDRGVVNQYRAVISGSMSYMIMGASTGWPSPTLSKMISHETPVVLDIPQTSLMVSIMFLGHISSPIPSGYLMDVFGRKRTCIILSILPISSWLLIFLASSPMHLYIARYVAGLWIGVMTTVMPIYVGEISSKKIRHSLTTINNLLLNFGVLFVYIIGPYVNYYNLAVACELLTILYVCMFFSMPESPVYLLKKEKTEEALTAFKWLRKDESLENIIQEMKEITVSLAEQRLQESTLKDIFRDRGNRKGFLISATFSVLKRFSGSGVIQAFASVTLPERSFGVLSRDVCVIVLGIVGLLSAVASTGLAFKFKRNTLLTVSCGGCALSTAVIAVWFCYKNTNYSDMIFVSLVLYYSVFNIGLGPIGTSIKGEILSTNVKALSSSLITLLTAFAGLLVNELYLIVADKVGMYYNYIFYSLMSILAIVIARRYLPDTNNKSLEEVRMILRNETVANYQCTNTIAG